MNPAFGQMPQPLFGSQAGLQQHPLVDLRGILPPQMNMMASMMLPYALQTLGGPNASLVGQFTPTQNLYDSMLAQQMVQQNLLSQQIASRADTARVQQMLAGAAQIYAGRRLSTAESAQMAYYGNTIGPMLPFMSSIIGPDMYDSLFGARGSSTVLQQSMQNALLSRRDAVTGFVGGIGGPMDTRSTTSGVITQELYAALTQNPTEFAKLRGMSAGRAGLLFDALASRGLAGPSIADLTARQRQEMFNQMPLDDARLTRIAERLPEIAKLGGPPSADAMAAAKQRVRDTFTQAGQGADIAALPGGADLLRAADADKIAGRIRDLSGVVAAMRDIFGDMGNPNAPMAELVAGLEALTQGGMTAFAPDKLERIVRTTNNLARQSRVSMENVLGLQAGAASLADQLGVSRYLVPEAVQGTLAFGGALQQAGRFDIANFQGGNLESAALLNQQLQMRFLASPQANLMAATRRLNAAGALKPDGVGAQLLKAIETGQTTFGPEGRSVMMSPTQFVELLKGEVDADTVNAVLSDTAGNQEFMQGIGFSLQRNLQRQDIESIMTPSIAGQFQAAGVDDASAAANELVSSVINLTPEQLRDPAQLQAHIRKVAGKYIKDERAVTEFAVAAPALLNTAIMTNPKTRGLSFLQVATQINPHLLSVAEAGRFQADVTTRMQSAFAPFGRAGFLARVSDIVARGDTRRPVSELIAEAIGATDVRGLTDSPAYRAVLETLDEFRALPRDPGTGAMTPEGATRAAQLMSRIEALTSDKASQAQQLLDSGVALPDSVRAGLQTVADGNTMFKLLADNNQLAGNIRPEEVGDMHKLGASLMEKLQAGKPLSAVRDDAAKYLGGVSGLLDQLLESPDDLDRLGAVGVQQALDARAALATTMSGAKGLIADPTDLNTKMATGVAATSLQAQLKALQKTLDGGAGGKPLDPRTKQLLQTAAQKQRDALADGGTVEALAANLLRNTPGLSQGALPDDLEQQLKTTGKSRSIIEAVSALEVLRAQPGAEGKSVGELLQDAPELFRDRVEPLLNQGRFDLRTLNLPSAGSLSDLQGAMQSAKPEVAVRGTVKITGLDTALLELEMRNAAELTRQVESNIGNTA